MTLPVEVRKALGVDDGDTLLFEERDGRFVIMARRDFVDPVAGSLSAYLNGEYVSVEDGRRSMSEYLGRTHESHNDE